MTSPGPHLVIGLGGSGIQVAARVAARRRNLQPGEARSALRVLAVDEHDQFRQSPPLPASVTFDEHEFVHLNDPPLIAREYLKARLPGDASLQAWWADELTHLSTLDDWPPGPSRMAKRLLYHRGAALLRQAIDRSLRDLIAVHSPGGAHVGGYVVHTSVVASACGTTGSAGILDTLGALAAVAQELEIVVRVDLFLLLPGAFALDVHRAPGAAFVVSRQRARTYACLRELDHFLSHPEELPDWMCDPVLESPGANARTPLAVKRVWLIDEPRGAMRRPSKVDAFDVTADGVLAVSTALRATSGLGQDMLWNELDPAGRRRAFGTFGTGVVAFPRAEVQRYLCARFAEWVLRLGILDEGAGVGSGGVEDRVAALMSESGASDDERWLERAAGELRARSAWLRAQADLADLDALDRPSLELELGGGPTLEKSQLVRQILDEMQNDVQVVGASTAAGRPSSAFVSILIGQVAAKAGSDGLAELGSPDSDARRAAIDRLIEVLTQVAIDLMNGDVPPKLPGSLDHVFHRADISREVVRAGLRSASEWSRSVWCDWSLAGAVVPEVPTTLAVVVRPREMPHLDRHLGLAEELPPVAVDDDDLDRLMYLTVEVGATAQAVAQLDIYQASYDEVVAQGGRASDEVAALHLDRRWPELLDDLQSVGVQSQADDN